MERKPHVESSEPTDDRIRASRETSARERLHAGAAGEVSAQPWRPDSLPPSDVDLAHFALWKSRHDDDRDILDGIALLPAARAEIEGLEAGLLFAARGAGITWAQIASAMGFKSPQACQQHFTRLLDRQSGA